VNKSVKKVCPEKKIVKKIMKTNVKKMYPEKIVKKHSEKNVPGKK